MTSWKIKDGVMPDDLKALLAEIIANHKAIDADGPPLPPWKAFPGSERISMRWRMGAGEDFMSEFREWFRALSEEEQMAFVGTHPEPEGWRGFYEQILRTK